MSDENKMKWKEIFCNPSRLGPLLAATLGTLLLAVALGQVSEGKLPFDSYWFVFPFTCSLLLLGTCRIIRELMVAATLLGVSWWGFSTILSKVWESGSITTAKATIIIAVILSWTILVALCLCRMRGGRDDD